MKYNDNGEYKDIYVKAFDTLPIGTEVDYDGSTVPSGWTEVNGNNLVVATLYETQDTTTPIQSITLSDDVSNYEYIEIYYTDTENSTYSSIKINKGVNKATLSLMTVSSTALSLYIRSTAVNISGTTIKVLGTRTQQISISKPSSSVITALDVTNLICVVKVVGYKEV